MESCSDFKSDRAAGGAPAGPVVGLPQPWAVCGGAVPRRKTSAWSDRCQAAWSRRLRVPLPMAEAREIKASLTMILETAWAIKAILERYGSD